MNNIVYALTFSSTNIACLSSLTAGRKEKQKTSIRIYSMSGELFTGLVRLLYSREPSQSGPDVIMFIGLLLLPHTVFSFYVFFDFCSTRQVYYRNQIGHLCIRDMSLVDKPYRHIPQLKHIVGNQGDRNEKICLYSDSNYYRIEVVKSSTSLVQKETQFCNPNLGSRKATIIIETQK